MIDWACGLQPQPRIDFSLFVPISVYTYIYIYICGSGHEISMYETREVDLGDGKEMGIDNGSLLKL